MNTSNLDHYSGEFSDPRAVGQIIKGSGFRSGTTAHQTSEVSMLADIEGAPYFDEVAEEFVLQSDSRLKKTGEGVKSKYYYRWKTPFTKFRGFWGTLFITYMPIAIFTLLIGVALMQGGVIDSKSTLFASHSWLGEQVVAGGPRNNADVTKYGRTERDGYLWDEIDDTDRAKALIGLFAVILTYTAFQGVKRRRRYFFINGVTHNAVRGGVYVHWLFTVMAILFWIHNAQAYLMTGENSLVWLGRILFSPAEYLPFVSWLLATAAAIPELYSTRGDVAVMAGLFPAVWLLSYGAPAWITALPGLIFVLFKEPKTLGGGNLGDREIMEVADNMERAGVLGSEGLRKQVRLRLAYAREAEADFGGYGVGLYAIMTIGSMIVLLMMAFSILQ